MSEVDEYEFNNIIKHIIKKSLFTERQIQIILRMGDRSGAGFGISRGAYYRQVGQTKTKLLRLYYTMSLLGGLGVLEARDIGVMIKLSKQVTELKNRDVFPEQEQNIMTVFDRVIEQAYKM